MFGETAAKILNHVAPLITEVPEQRVINPGQDVAWDCEMLYVGYVQSQAFSEGVPPCPIRVDAVFKVGILRNTCVLDDGGDAPPPAKITEDGWITGTDQFEILQALRDFRPAVDPETGKETGPEHQGILGIWTPLGPEGGLSGGEWQYTVRYPL